MSNVKTFANAARIVASKETSRPFRVSIEGNIGSGKSTCINFFDKFNNVEKHTEPLHEWRNVSGHNLLGLVYTDLHKWTFPFQHYVHLTRLKIQTSPPSNPNITVKMFERSVQNSRFCFVENAKNHKFLHDAEYQVLTSWYEYVEKNLDIGLDLIVYLKSSPKVVWERMMKRGRAEESEVPLEYLQQSHGVTMPASLGASELGLLSLRHDNSPKGACRDYSLPNVMFSSPLSNGIPFSIICNIPVHDAYENWLNSPDVGCEVLTIDADRSLDIVKEDLQRYTYKILGGNHTN